MHEDSICGENITPDLNIFDYAIAFNWMIFGDRYFRLPFYRLYINEDNHVARTKDFFQGIYT